jgi:16S rRNA (guanine527-N7)-methyltransferase
MEEILKYFPDITEEQKRQFAMLDALYREWNQKINVISRKDIDQLYVHHVLHSLAIAKVADFKNGMKILDLGTGGGFPGIPLAIMYPECKFKLIDGTGKKIRVCQEVSSAIGLKNVVAEHIRGEEEMGLYDYVVSRAVMPFADLEKLVRKNMKNGLICLKGGNLKEEVKGYKNICLKEIHDFFDEEWFEEKYVVSFTK